MQLSNSFTIARPEREVYDAFLDVDQIATCMPGSTLLGQSGEDTYDGEVKVKVGPLSVVYSGQFTILDRDPENNRLTMRAKAREKRGSGNVDAYIVATLDEQDGVTTVNLATELNIRGKVAQFGRGVIGEVSDGIMQTFANNVEQMLMSSKTPAAATPSSGPATASTGGPSTNGTATGATASSPIEEPATTFVDTEGEELDAWDLLIKPMLHRHAGSIVTVAMSGLAAYVGARSGTRFTRTIPPRRRYY